MLRQVAFGVLVGFHLPSLLDGEVARETGALCDVRTIRIGGSRGDVGALRAVERMLDGIQVQLPMIAFVARFGASPSSRC